MTPELQAQLAAYLKTLLETTKAAGSLAVDQLPLIVQEKIAYGRVIETWQLVLFAAVTYLGYRLFRWGAREDAKGYGHGHEAAMPGLVFGAIVAIVAGLLTVIQTSYVAQVWLAPRLYIIEWVAHLAK